MVGIKCFNICYSYYMNNMTVLLEDIETGCMAAFYNPCIPDAEVRNDIHDMIKRYSIINNTVPQTVLFFGEYEYGDEMIYLHINDITRLGFMPYKLYACCLCVLEDRCSFTFVNKLNGNQIITKNASNDLVQFVLDFANKIYMSGYNEFYFDGVDSIIIGGNISNVSSDHIIVQFDKDYIFGTKDAIYEKFCDVIINDSQSFGYQDDVD